MYEFTFMVKCPHHLYNLKVQLPSFRFGNVRILQQRSWPEKKIPFNNYILVQNACLASLNSITFTIQVQFYKLYIFMKQWHNISLANTLCIYMLYTQ